MGNREPIQVRFKVDAVTFDYFGTLRFSVSQEDIIYPISRVLSENIRLDEAKFLDEYFKMDTYYRKRLKETLRESLPDDIIIECLKSLGFKSQTIENIVKRAVDRGLTTRRTR